MPQLSVADTPSWAAVTVTEAGQLAFGNTNGVTLPQLLPPEKDGVVGVQESGFGVTMICCEQETVVIPSDTCQLIKEVPTGYCGNNGGFAAKLKNEREAQLSETLICDPGKKVGALDGIKLLPGTSTCTVKGLQISVGGVWSVTVTCRLHTAVFPEASVACHVTVKDGPEVDNI